MIVLPFNNAGAESTQHTSRIYCDCDGTLFQTRQNGQFNENLFRFLIDLKKQGHDVRLFSAEVDANEGRVQMYSRKFAGDVDFFKKDGFVITPKEHAAGEHAFLVIDDNHASHNVTATHRWNPDDPAVIAHIAQAVRPCESGPKAPSANRLSFGA